MSSTPHTYYRLYDPNPSQGGAIEIDRHGAQKWNEQGWGIFWTVQTFKGQRRASNLMRINAFAVDIDAGSKEDQLKRIREGLVPSLVVETKRGYQVYWLAKDATVLGYRPILLERLVPFYGGDTRATDLCRILRVPGFYHCKEPSDRFLVRTVHRYPVAYTEQEICLFYPPSPEALALEEKKREFKSLFITENRGQSDGLWQRVWEMDCEEALTRLSGHAAVGQEHFGFKRVANGNLNILVNCRGTSCWIDRDKRIGSLDRGGPTIYQWINWYQRNPKRTVEFMKEVFPELWSTCL